MNKHLDTHLSSSNVDTETSERSVNYNLIFNYGDFTFGILHLNWYIIS